MILPLFLGFSLAHARVDRLTRVEQIADQVATAVYAQIADLESLEGRLQSGELSPNALKFELDKLAAELRVIASPARGLIDHAPMSHRQVMTRAALEPGSAVMAMAVAGLGYLGYVGAIGALYYHFTSPMFADVKGSLLHAGASVGVAYVAGTIALVVLAETTGLIVKGWRKIRGIHDQDRMTHAYFARLAARGLNLQVDQHRLTMRPQDFGGSIFEDLNVIQTVANQMSARVPEETKTELRPIVEQGYRTMSENPRVVLAEVAGRHQLFDEFRLVDLLTLGPKPVISRRCNALLNLAKP